MKQMNEYVDDEVKKRHMVLDSQCHEKAVGRGQLTFTVVEQDRSAARTIAFWILENIETAPAAKLYDALECALVARQCPNKKNAD